MFSGLLFGGKKKEDKKGSDFEIEGEEEDEADAAWCKSLRVNLSRLIVYAESADVRLQREVRKDLH